MLQVHNKQQGFMNPETPSRSEVEADFLRAIIIANLPQLVLSMKCTPSSTEPSARLLSPGKCLSSRSDQKDSA